MSELFYLKIFRSELPFWPVSSSLTAKEYVYVFFANPKVIILMLTQSGIM
jgi:hypothetical protein